MGLTLLAVRFPYTEEIIKGKAKDIQVKSHWMLDVRQNVMDFIIAEVSSTVCKFNWINPNSTEQIVNSDFLRYALRRIGHWNLPNSHPPSQVCDELSHRKYYEDRLNSERVRLMSIGVTHDENLTDIPQIEFEKIFEYMRDHLFNSYDLMEGQKVIQKVVSDHKQWDPMICEIYNRLRGHKQKACDPADVVRWLFPDAYKKETG